MKGSVSSLQRLAADLRLILLYGSDTSASADLARSIARSRGGDAETIFAASTLTTDPGALVAAASAIPMFGGLATIRVDDAGEEILAAVVQILKAAATENLVLVVAGALKKGSKLVAAVEEASSALAVVSFNSDAAEAGSSTAKMAIEYGLRLSRDAVGAIVAATGGDRGIARQELIKLALYVDADPTRAVHVELSDVMAITADFGDADLDRLVDAVVGGDPVAAERQLAEFGAGTVSGITLLRAVGRRLWLLLDLRAMVDGGASASRAVAAARPPVFWKSRDGVANQLTRWRSPALRVAINRLLDIERGIKRSGSAGDIAVDQALLALAVQAKG